MPSALNQKIVSEYRDLFAKARSCLLIDMQGMSVEQSTAFRALFRDKSLHIEVVRNALASIVVEEHGYPGANGMFAGSTAVVYAPSGAADEATIVAAKMYADWRKKSDKPALKGALFEGQALDSTRAEGLAKMPGRAEVLGQIVTLALSPGRRLAGAILGAGGGVAASIKGLVEKLEKETPAAPAAGDSAQAPA
jgi:large subunit ribosomal protein L10